MNNGTDSAPAVTRMAKQVWRGIPYVQKELLRSLSMKTGRTLATPQMYYVIFSGRCNVACTFCTIYKEVEPMLSPEVMLRIVREARELSGAGFNISLSGGEPLIYKPLYDALDLAHKLKVNFGFTTNGYLLTKQNVARALASNLFNVNVSIESVTPEVNESVRPRKNGTQQTLDGIDNLVMEKRRTGARVSIIVKTTIMEQNYRTLPELVRYFSKYKEVQVSFQPYFGPVQSGFWIRDVAAFERVVAELKELLRAGCGLMADEATLDGFVGYFQHPPKADQAEMARLNLEGKKRGCDIGYRSLSIYPNGGVQFCDLLQRDIGNVNTQNLKDIYYGEVAARVRGGINHCNIDCQRTCQRAIPISTKVRSFLRMG
ncbi:MAG TPA: radical SAM protein [Verrucomicrobiae bacterium]|jgi:sulfatase maturation enzyme AslB (radical SAM superfamily)